MEIEKLSTNDTSDVQELCLIRTSHKFMEYSFIRKRPELECFLPVRFHSAGLNALYTKSATRAIEIMGEYTSENTRLAHNGDLVYWQAWLSAIGFSFKSPITLQELITFIIQHTEGLDPDIDTMLVDQGFKAKLGPHKLATVKRRIGSLSVFLESAKWPNPCHDHEVHRILAQLTKKYGSSKPAGRAITKDVLDDMLETCRDQLIDIRDRAMLLFAWGSGGRRRAEVTCALMKDLTRLPDGSFVYNIPTSKTDQEGKGAPVPVKGRVAHALDHWLTISGIEQGPLFRSIGKGGKIKDKPLSPVDIYRIVRRRLEIAGYDFTQFGAHSLRSGFVTEAGRKNKNLGDVMALTTHKSVTTVMRYYQAGSIINNSAANLAD